MPLALQHRDAAPTATAPMRSARRPRRLVSAAAAAAVVVPLGWVVVDQISGWRNPFATETVDRSTTPLLLALADLHEYHAATGTFQVVVDQERDTPWVPAVISGEHVQFLATGTVDASVDFAGLDSDAVTLSPDGQSATITLPAPELGAARIDAEQSRVLDRDRGIVQRLGDLVEDDPTDDTGLYGAAQDEIESAAAGSDLLDRAADGTREMLTTLANSLGVDDVTVVFEAAPGDAG